MTDANTLMQQNTARKQEYDMVVSRVIGAPRERVFDAWTHAEQVQQWWGPAGFTNPVCEVDARPNGMMRIDMRGPDGTVYPMTAQFLELVKPDRLVMVSSALDDQGNSMFDVHTTVTFEDEQGNTRLTVAARVLRKHVADADNYLSGMEAGWTQSLERLSAFAAHL